MAAALHYHVGNNTPGYIPEGDVYCSETLEHAKAALREDVENYVEGGWDTEGLDLHDAECFPRVQAQNLPQDGGLHYQETYAGACLVKHELYEVSWDSDGQGAYVGDRSKTYDLGRVFWIAEVSNSECEDFEREEAYG